MQKFACKPTNHSSQLGDWAKEIATRNSGKNAGNPYRTESSCSAWTSKCSTPAKEAVMHAIYRQNFGFTDIIIGRKHADAPYNDGSAIWGDFDAQEIFEHLNGDLQIQPLNEGFAAYYESIGRVI